MNLSLFHKPERLKIYWAVHLEPIIAFMITSKEILRTISTYSYLSITTPSKSHKNELLHCYFIK
jgi:hypothetical protein